MPTLSPSRPSPNRHLTRQATFQALFEADFRGNDARENFARVYEDVGAALDRDFATSVIQTVTTHREEIDKKILEAAPNWPIDQVAKVDKAILRLAIAELFYSPTADVPSRVAINEAVELAKKFGGANSASFINGVLGTLYRNYGHDA